MNTNKGFKDCLKSLKCGQVILCIFTQPIKNAFEASGMNHGTQATFTVITG